MPTSMETAQMAQETTREEGSAVKFSKKQIVFLYIKRVCDVLLALLAGAVLIVPMALICLIIKLESPGPALFAQDRMGKDGKTFVIYKLRTMRITAPRDLAACSFSDSDQYITKFGRFLRRTSIDELPQLYNVLRGDMSLVGYRPLCLTETAVNEMRARNGVFALRPGITGLAQVCGRDSITSEEKVSLDTKYVTECSLKMDILCLVKTVTTVITGKGVL